MAARRSPSKKRYFAVGYDSSASMRSFDLLRAEMIDVAIDVASVQTRRGASRSPIAQKFLKESLQQFAGGIMAVLRYSR